MGLHSMRAIIRRGWQPERFQTGVASRAQTTPGAIWTVTILRPSIQESNELFFGLEPPESIASRLVALKLKSMRKKMVVSIPGPALLRSQPPPPAAPRAISSRIHVSEKAPDSHIFR